MKAKNWLDKILEAQPEETADRLTQNIVEERERLWWQSLEKSLNAEKPEEPEES